jgi:hypothetical protein
MPEPLAVARDPWNDLQPVLDEELTRLPDKYRLPIIVCDLEGKTRKEAARQLGLPEGTMASRLARGRTMLARRLARRGLAFSGLALGSALAQSVDGAAVPNALVSSTIKAAGVLAAGQATVASVVSTKVALLTEGVLKAMLLSKIKIATAMLVAVGITAGAVSAWGTNGLQGQGRPAAAAPVQKQQPASGAEKMARPVDWQDVSGAAQAWVMQRVADIHPKSEAPYKVTDCKKCHSASDAAPMDKFHPRESDREKIDRLERELTEVRNQNELLQLEVWILLREIQKHQESGKVAK